MELDRHIRRRVPVKNQAIRRRASCIMPTRRLPSVHVTVCFLMRRLLLFLGLLGVLVQQGIGGASQDPPPDGPPAPQPFERCWLICNPRRWPGATTPAWSGTWPICNRSNG